MRHRILLAVAFLYLAAANVIWIAQDTRPPFWDMAAHGSSAVRVYDAFADSWGRAIVRIPSEQLTGYYPPLYHVVVAGFWWVFGQTLDVAQLANLGAMLVLLLATYGIGRTITDPWTASIAAVIVSFYPYLLWISRETVLDYWLTAIVATAFWVLIQTKEFSDRRWSIAFGAICGVGMLTKWTFPFFVLLPAIWLGRRHWANAALAAAIAGSLAAYWYIPAASAMGDFLKINISGGISEGDPGRLSWQALVFYVRALAGYQIFLPLFAAFITAIVIVARTPQPKWFPVMLWLVGGWLGLLLFLNKDPRYSAPLLPAVALVTAAVFSRRTALTVVLFTFLIIQHVVVSFGTAWIPESVVLMKGVEGPLSWHWNVYTQSYFGLWGAPAREDWPIRHVLDEVGQSDDKPVRLGVAPDIPRFDTLAFQFYIDLMKAPVHLRRVGVSDEPSILSNDYILLSEDQRKHVASYAADERVNNFVATNPQNFQAVDRFSLPTGEIMRLYRVQ